MGPPRFEFERTRALLLPVLFCTALVVACSSIADSHPAANVPTEQDFDAFMKRDLRAYFSQNVGRTVQVEYSFLRLGPTQTGVSYPKYYVWVVVKDTLSGPTQLEGAARVAAVDRIRFDVTDFLSKTEIILNPETIQSVFPASVCNEIKKRL
jgi:hypothetical protein